MTVPEPRRVLIATVDLTEATGTANYTRDLAVALLRHGWLPIVYSTRLGAAADALRWATIPVVSSLDAVGAAPDVIHGQHLLETLTALARFPNVPAVWVCHDGITWHSVPPRTPRIRAHVAVDRHCRDRMIFEHGVKGDVRVLTNAVDLVRFRRRGPLPDKPRRALIFSNAAAPNNFASAIVDACRDRGIEVDFAGETSDRGVTEPETILPQYDLVFAKARCAFEAAASGAAVIVLDHRGMVGMITSERVESMRQVNFGIRALQLPVTRENVLREIDRYDAADAARVTDGIRAASDADLLAEQLIDIYEEISAEPMNVSPREDLDALASALGGLTPRFYRQVGAPPRTPSMRLRTALLNSKTLAGPVRLAWRLKKRLLS